ncbi:auxilin-like clathrin-binding protein required for normal clathrin function [Malassezia sp. CBS 17886]|nr:auxilin-like clathrin-binding protein required for normal clathrin function [Malassezia sp. CBS 17886]
MDDLAELDFAAPAAASRPATSNAYSFDALLRSMPAGARDGRPPGGGATPPVRARNPADGRGAGTVAPAPTATPPDFADAFSSLLPTTWASSSQSAMRAGTPLGELAKSAQTPLSRGTTPAPRADTAGRPDASDVWALDALESSAQSAGPRAGRQPVEEIGARQPAADAAVPVGGVDLLGDAVPARASRAPERVHSGADDLLGDLGRPVPALAPQQEASSPEAPHSAAENRAQTRRGRSPPPHVVGRLVEMGFPPDAARAALAQTTSGSDVEWATRILVENAPPAPPASPTERVGDASARRPPRPAPAAVSAMPHTSALPQAARDDGTDEWQQYAHTLHTQANELRSNVLKSANALWGSAKAHAQRTIDDVREADGASDRDMNAMQMAAGVGRHAWRRWGSAVASAQGKTPIDWDGRPRWMQGELDAAGEVIGAPSKALPPRTLPSEDAASVSRAATLKAVGNDAFQRGAYAEAEEHYTHALASLHSDSLRRVPLLNNRANVRLKNGDSDGAIADCTASLALIVPESSGGDSAMYRAGLDAPLPAELREAVHLREAFAKSVAQRARAHEAKERWALARKDWSLLHQYERSEGSGTRTGDGSRRSAAEGIARCDGMLRPRGTAPKRADAAPDARVEAASRAGVERVHAQRTAQTEEDERRLKLKGTVDARIQAWVNGKQGNVRALLASIDDPSFGLVWPELGYRKVGMHELVTDAQVKRSFTRAIARLHPDKLPPGTTSTEQQMLASAMFNALNEAYNA